MGQSLSASFAKPLELYIAEQRGSGHLANTKSQTELRKVKKEIAELKKKLTVLSDSTG